jgi:hypothetical protein
MQTNCHPDKPHEAHGKRRSCYVKEYRKTNPPKRYHSYETYKKYYEAHKSEFRKRARKTHLKLRFGISPRDYDEIFDRQGGLCAICKEKSLKRLSVDHNHLTGEVRGLLCASCNFGLGFFKDNPESLKNAISYLKEPKMSDSIH